MDGGGTASVAWVATLVVTLAATMVCLTFWAMNHRPAAPSDAISDAPPRIVVLDGGPMHGGDLDWSSLESLGHLAVYPRTTPDELLDRSADAVCLLTNKVVLDADAMAALPKLRYIGVTATGVNVVDLAAAERHDVTVTNVPAYSTASVAQHVFALLLELCSHVAAHDAAVHDAPLRDVTGAGTSGPSGLSGPSGGWPACSDFSFTVSPITELAGKTLGIVGLGDIGQAVARIGAAMGMSITAADTQRSRPSLDLPNGVVQWRTLDELFRHADVLTLHCPLTDRTTRLVNAERLASMKPTAWLVNTGRGALIDEAALATALHDKRLAGAGLDVLSHEPPAADNPLLRAPRCIITPHVAWASVEARRRLMNTVADNLRAFLAGRPINIVH